MAGAMKLKNSTLAAVLILGFSTGGSNLNAEAQNCLSHNEMACSSIKDGSDMFENSTYSTFDVSFDPITALGSHEEEKPFITCITHCIGHRTDDRSACMDLSGEPLPGSTPEEGINPINMCMESSTDKYNACRKTCEKPPEKPK